MRAEDAELALLTKKDSESNWSEQAAEQDVLFSSFFLDDIIQKLAWLLLLQTPKQIKVQNGNLSLVLYSLEVRAMTRCNWVPGQHERPRRGSKKVWHHSFFASNYWRYASLVTLPTIEPISQHRRDWKTPSEMENEMESETAQKSPFRQ